MYYSNNNYNNEKVLKVVEKTLEMIKYLNTYKFRTTSINKAMSGKDRQEMIRVINIKWVQYMDFANSLSCFTNYYVRSVDKNFYDDKPIDYLINQLKDIKIFVALKILEKHVERELIKKVLKEFGIATDEQLKNI